MQQTVTMAATMPAYPARPASPTLTNPDMILPYGEYDSASSPPRTSFRPDANGEPWRGSAPSSLPFSIGPPRTPRSAVTPITPIIYGNGTMLSDIGEVTEAESTPGRRLPGPAERRMLKQARSPLRSGSSAAHRGPRRVKPESHGRKVSPEPPSAATEEQQSAVLFGDLDDCVSVDDSNFQGDDEGSVADSYSEEVVAMEIQRLAKLEDSLDRDDDPNSSAALSRRAEQILLNAKKRLNNMEGNLTRARSSLDITPSGVMSSIHSSSPLSRSTPSPQNDPKKSPPLSALPAKHRQFDVPVKASISSPGHSRAYSENSIAPDLGNASFQNQSAGPGTHRVDTEESDRNQISPPAVKNRSTSLDENRSSVVFSPSGPTSPLHSVHLEPLDEEKAVPGFGVDQDSIRFSLEKNPFDSGEQRVLTRSTSSMQMRGLRDQMHDLKGRLSVLRDRARDDTMKRRSLQGLRTPSPFTAADQWYTADKGYVTSNLTDAEVKHAFGEKVEMVSHPVENRLPDVNKGVASEAPDYCQSEATSIYEEAIEAHHGVDHSADNHETEVPRDLQNEMEENTEDDENLEVDDDVSEYHDGVANSDEHDIYESDSSIYHDATSISHEDREDAFDYEHFFLHSAMGTINQERLDRRGSFSSEDSGDTARGPGADEKRSSGYLRTESAASITTVNTFATATEGLESEADDQDYQYDYAVAVPVGPVAAEAVKRSTIITTGSKNSAGTPTPETSRPVSVVYSPEDRDPKALHRPSAASFGSFQSTGTTRSFPLIHKSKSQGSSPNNMMPVNQRNGYSIDERALRSYLGRLVINLEAQVVNASVESQDASSQELIYSGSIQDSEDPLIVVQDPNETQDNPGEGHILVVWKLSAFLVRPRLRLHSPSVMFSATASLKPVEQVQADILKDEYLHSQVPSGMNLLEAFNGDPSLGGIQPRLSALRVSRVAPAGLVAKEMMRPLRNISRQAIRVYPAINARVRYSRINTSPTNPTIIASLDLDITPYANCEISVWKVQLGLTGGDVEDLNSVSGMKLPIRSFPQDNIMFLYRLNPDDLDVPNKSLIRSLDISIAATAHVSPTCKPEISMTWTTVVDFTPPVNAGFGLPAQPIHRANRPSQLSIDSSTFESIPPVSSLAATRPDALPSIEVATRHQRNPSVPDFGVTMTFTGPSEDTPVYPGIPFTWSVFIVNQSDRSRKLVLAVLPRRRRTDARITRPPSTGHAGPLKDRKIANAVVDENIVYAMQHNSALESTDIICMSSDIRVGPLAPSSCYEVELKFMALKVGILNLEAVRVVDLGTQEHVDIRDLPTIAVSPLPEA